MMGKSQRSQMVGSSGGSWMLAEESEEDLLNGFCNNLIDIGFI